MADNQKNKFQDGSAKKARAADFFRAGYKSPLGEPIEIYWRIDQWYRDLPKETLEKINVYYEELLKFNNTINLINVKSISTADATHFADSITAAKHIVPLLKPESELYDFGSGNGFPGMIIGIMYPSVRMVLVDSDQRKCEFLKHVVTKLNIQNVKVVATQIERMPEASVEFGVTREFAGLAKSVLLLRRVFKRGGTLFHLKGEEWFNEISGLPTQLCMYWKPGLVAEYRIPESEIQYAVVRTDRIGS